MFDILGTSGSGLRAHRVWLDAVSDNIANINTARPTSEEAFRARFIQVQSVQEGDEGKGVRVTRVVFGDPEGRLVYQPDHPYADDRGLVRYPDVDLGQQMSHLLLAQRGYQANIAVITRAQEAYQAALTIGR